MVTVARAGARGTYGRVKTDRARSHRRRAGRASAQSPLGRMAARPLFLARATQHVSSYPSARDWVGGAAMLAAAASWGLLASLLAR